MKSILNFGILNEVIGMILSQKITLLDMESDMLADYLILS